MTGGRLVLVGTPIGNLGDLSPRASSVLGGADVIACEDTRVTRKLLSHAGITARRLISVHAHNEATAAKEVVDLVAGGAMVAMVTDAGLPGISDPGERLVKAVTLLGSRRKPLNSPPTTAPSCSKDSVSEKVLCRGWPGPPITCSAGGRF